MSDPAIIPDLPKLPSYHNYDCGVASIKAKATTLRVRDDGPYVTVGMLLDEHEQLFTMPAAQARHFSTLLAQATDRAEAHVAL